MANQFFNKNFFTTKYKNYHKFLVLKINQINSFLTQIICIPFTKSIILFFVNLSCIIITTKHLPIIRTLQVFYQLFSYSCGTHYIKYILSPCVWVQIYYNGGYVSVRKFCLFIPRPSIFQELFLNFKIDFILHISSSE